MAKQLDVMADASKQLSGLREMVKETLEAVSTMGSRQTEAEALLADLRDQAEAATTTMRETSSRVYGLPRRVDSINSARGVANPTSTGVLGGILSLPAPTAAGFVSASLLPGGAPPVAVTTVGQLKRRELDLNVVPASLSQSPTGDAARLNGTAAGSKGPGRRNFDMGTFEDAHRSAVHQVHAPCIDQPIDLPPVGKI